MLNSTLSSLLAAQPAARGATQAPSMLDTCKKECQKLCMARLPVNVRNTASFRFGRKQDVGRTAVVLPLESCVRPRA